MVTHWVITSVSVSPSVSPVSPVADLGTWSASSLESDAAGWFDLSAVPQTAVGGSVTVLGRSGDGSIALEDIARWQGAGVNDVLMAFNDRIAQTIC